MKADKYTWLGKICGNFAQAEDLSIDGVFVATSNVVRIAAKADAYIQNVSLFTEGTNGVFLPQGCVEYFRVEIGDNIKVISGEINICSII